MPMKADPPEPTPEAPSVEIPRKATRRTFSAAYKRKILERTAALKGEPGKIGALLRQEGLYTSHLSAWRRELKQGRLGQEKARRGRAPRHDTRGLVRENKRLQERLRVAEGVIEVQRKLCGLFGLPTADGEPQK
jgi:transposase